MKRHMNSSDEMRFRDTDADGRNDYIDSDGYSKPYDRDKYMRLTEDEYNRLCSADSKYSEQCRISNAGDYILNYSSSEKDFIDRSIATPVSRTAKIR